MHFLRKTEIQNLRLPRLRAFVTVKLEGKSKLIIQEGISMAKIDTQWAELPARVKVFDPDGEEVLPEEGNRFYVSVESFNPCHALIEATPEFWYG